MERTDAVGDDSERAVQLAKYLDLDIATKRREAVRADQKCMREYSEANATTFRDALVDDLRNGSLDDEIPPHGTLARVRQTTPDNWADTGRRAQEAVDAR